jgi:aconitate hydratase
LKPWVSAKDVILEVLRIMTVKGGVGKIIEYGGNGVDCLTVPQRATITNMGAELGATTSIFPSDENTRAFLKSQGREKVWQPLAPDAGATYDEVIQIDLSKLEPMIAQPHSPDNVVKVQDIAGAKVQQVAIGSCTNSSYVDMMTVAGALKGKQIHPDVSLVISPGSRQVLEMISRNGALADMISAGARILETACGPCIGMGQAPPNDSVSVRSFNRNFLGRSGTKSANVYLASPEVCVAAALNGVITDPRDLGKAISIAMPEKFHIDDRMVLAPSDQPEKVKIIRGPNIKPLPINKPLPDTLEGELLLKVEDNITTDHIMPAGAKILPLRSNIPEISKHVFEVVDETFPSRALQQGGGFIVGGENYGQGSSREHAALAPMYLGIKWVLTRSFARIHKANLINFGILPLTFENPEDYDKFSQNDQLRIQNVIASLRSNEPLLIENLTKNMKIAVTYDLSERAKEIIIAGGLLNYTREQQ